MDSPRPIRTSPSCFSSGIESGPLGWCFRLSRLNSAAWRQFSTFQESTRRPLALVAILKKKAGIVQRRRASLPFSVVTDLADPIPSRNSTKPGTGSQDDGALKTSKSESGAEVDTDRIVEIVGDFHFEAQAEDE